MVSCSMYSLFGFLNSVYLLKYPSILLYESIAHSFLLLSSLPLYGHTIIFFFTHLLMDIWVVTSFWILQIKLLWIFLSKSFCGHMSPFFLGKNLWVECLGRMVSVCFTLFWTAGLLPSLRARIIPHPYQHLLWIAFYTLDIRVSIQ